MDNHSRFKRIRIGATKFDGYRLLPAIEERRDPPSHPQRVRLGGSVSIRATATVMSNFLDVVGLRPAVSGALDGAGTQYDYAKMGFGASADRTTGLMQSPAISNRLGWFGRVLNRQAARSIHFISFSWFVLFILAHGIMVFVTSLRQNTNHMFAGREGDSWAGIVPFIAAMVVVGVAWWLASPFTLRQARLVQKVGGATG